MSEVLDCIKTRRSIRKFKPDMVPRELIDKVLEAGTWAPSGRGAQSGIIIAITNKELRDKLSEMNRVIWKKEEGFDPFFGAPVVLVVLANTANSTCIHDGSCIMENMLLAAHDLGLGGIWIHRAKQEFESPEGRAILDSLGIEGEYVGVGHCCIGYKDGEDPEPKPRKENYIYYIE